VALPPWVFITVYNLVEKVDKIKISPLAPYRKKSSDAHASSREIQDYLMKLVAESFGWTSGGLTIVAIATGPALLRSPLFFVLNFVLLFC